MKAPSEIRKIADTYFNNITDSVSFVFSSLLQMDVRQKKVYSKRLASLPNDIIITLDFTADRIGFFSFFFPLKTAQSICNKLVPSLSEEFFDAEHLDVLGEVGNMISGNAIGKLLNIDASLNLETPYLSAFHKVLAAEKMFWNFSCNYELPEGRIGILLALQKD